MPRLFCNSAKSRAPVLLCHAIFNVLYRYVAHPMRLRHCTRRDTIRGGSLTTQQTAHGTQNDHGVWKRSTVHAFFHHVQVETHMCKISKLQVFAPQPFSTHRVSFGVPGFQRKAVCLQSAVIVSITLAAWRLLRTEILLLRHFRQVRLELHMLFFFQTCIVKNKAPEWAQCGSALATLFKYD